jgi:phosphonopyruvate decarboxylase
LGISYSLLPENDAEAISCLNRVKMKMLSLKETYALIVRKGTFCSYRSGKTGDDNSAGLTREEALSLLLDKLEPTAVVVSTTGKLSREIFEYRVRTGQGHERDFLNVGSMGHASQIALGIALNQPHRPVYCFDGDGALLMHMGGLAVIANSGASNYRHIIFNNGAHDSVGGQPTLGLKIDLLKAAEAMGYKSVKRAHNGADLMLGLEKLQNGPLPGLVEVRVRKGARKDLGRPTTTPEENKIEFMKYLEG